eukprot:CAMPEP_0194218066 /NCGR_PEP_ID=MMETSP0156-20130528/22919_1 /TAXON_ID=33649 /ORGANISM="Thalassionema nitzschioides, Strain L26-B" /LENGTH=99 /DNA_ID=CAMNT_0038947299 /DNA_START=1241 /DNA_END=1540 /DNA_ORIENTATION=+
MAIILLTVLVMGGSTETMLYVWKVPTNVTEEEEDISFLGAWEERLYCYLRPPQSPPPPVSSLMDYSVMGQEQKQAQPDKEEENNYVTVTTESIQLADSL